MPNTSLGSLQFRSSVLLRLNVVLHWRISTIENCLSSKIVFHQNLSSIKGCLPSKVIFYQKTSSIKNCLSSKVILPSINGCHPSKCLSSIESCHPTVKYFDLFIFLFVLIMKILRYKEMCWTILAKLCPSSRKE